MDKPFKSIDEQLQLLKDRGLYFNNDEEAKDYLLRNNYYNVVNCYGHFLKVPGKDEFITGAAFSEMIAIHQFDGHFKSALFKSLLDVENSFKSVLAYEFSKEYLNEINPYLNQANYNQNRLPKVINLLSDLNKILSKYMHINISNNSIKHYVNRHKHVPLWVLCNYMTFGQAVTMYDLINTNIQNEIAKNFSISLNKNFNLTKKKFLHPNDIYLLFGNFKDVRNQLAHDNMIFNYKTRTSCPYFAEVYSKYSLNPSLTRQNIFDVVIDERLFFNEGAHYTLCNSLAKSMRRLEKKLKTVSIDTITGSLGFPKDFRKLCIKQ